MKAKTGARYIVGLGANMGSARATLRAATARIASRADVFAMRESQITRTPPVGPAQPHYLNAAASFYSDLPPRVFLKWLQQIERELGRDRDREVRFGPRTLDLDLLHVSTGAIRTPTLIVPHPRLTERAFALLPLLEVAPELEATYGTAAGQLVDDRAPLDPIEVRRTRTNTQTKITAEGAERDRLDVLASVICAFVSDRRVVASAVQPPIPLRSDSLLDELSRVLMKRPADISHATLLRWPRPGTTERTHNTAETALCWLGSAVDHDATHLETREITLKEATSDGRVRVDLSATT